MAVLGKRNPFLSWAALVLFSVGGYIGLNYYLWEKHTNVLFWPYPNCGDLARMAYAPQIAQCREDVRTLKRQMALWDSNQPEKFDVMTFGDSFSRGRGGGLNNYYQDFIATIHNLKVTWAPEIEGQNYIQDVVILQNSGFLKKYGVKHLVLQSIERSAVDRTMREVDWQKTMPLPEVEERLTKETDALFGNFRFVESTRMVEELKKDERWEPHIRAALTQILFMNLSPLIMPIDKWISELEKKYLPEKKQVSHRLFWALNFFARSPGYEKYSSDALTHFASRGELAPTTNVLNIHYKWVLHKLVYGFDVLELQDPVRKEELKGPMFTGAEADQLYFHAGDIKTIVYATERVHYLESMHKNLNELATRLKKDGITLHFFPTPTKYRAYQAYLEDPNLPKSRFYEVMASFKDKKYEYIDAAAEVDQLIASGEKDVYYKDDTHWSSKALDVVIRKMHF